MSQRNNDNKKTSWSSGTSPAMGMPSISANMQTGIINYLDGEIQKSNNLNEMKRLETYKNIVADLNKNGKLTSTLRDDKMVGNALINAKIRGYNNQELLKENIKAFRDIVSAGIRATVTQNAPDKNASNKNELPAPARHRRQN